MISASILDIKDPKDLEVYKLCELGIDLIHVDVMDGIFVENKTMNYENYKNVLRYSIKPLDVHLMVSDVKKYIDEYSRLNPKYITFHYEAVSDVRSVINYIKEKNIKVGMSIKPSTDVSEIVDYLQFLDLILVMSVEPGRGGQTFIDNSTKKINQLNELREKLNLNYLIEVDGGINDLTILDAKNADIYVAGSFIVKGNYEEQINKLRIKL